MKVENNVTRSLAQTASVVNVLNGGIAMPFMKLEKRKEGYIYNVQLAGVNPEDFNVEIDSNNLFIYNLITLQDMKVPYLLKRMVIPAQVDYNEITAEYSDGRLRVFLPFNGLASDYHREVDIIKRA
ncbi:MAG: Hsp20/alpha crystallin family protein [Bacteroidota bacterium]